MVSQQEITAAIGAHGLWKRRLQFAIDDGTSSQSVETACKDNLCQFGKWLYSPATASARGSTHYEKCRRLHAEFHVATADVLKLALAGDKVAARRELNDGRFAHISADLTRAMQDWKKTLA
ncbi:CZB domain-containing protein [Alsobacter sp. SYSU M60028]|uniref:CZB domain-containing protein n=1 Tax=Alsobacter ponti TaxID=2962936 RepID=A0ABT1LB20_9HYPH|nr:CZB domain-containing protein [Alsobacter ponti]MCP8938686.1 CZB domain-containing protein [Alsobacter ponti]